MQVLANTRDDLTWPDDALVMLPQIYFPTVYDIKYLMKFCDNLHGGLNKLAESLEVDRIGPQHQVVVPPKQGVPQKRRKSARRRSNPAKSTHRHHVKAPSMAVPLNSLHQLPPELRHACLAVAADWNFVLGAQAGSDSLLTSATFLKLAKTFFKGVESMDGHRDVLYGEALSL